MVGYCVVKKNGNLNTFSHQKHTFHAFLRLTVESGLLQVRSGSDPVKSGLARLNCKLFSSL